MAGDTLYKLARMYFGTDSAWKKIRDANPEIDPDNLLLHARIIIPK